MAKNFDEAVKVLNPGDTLKLDGPWETQGYDHDDAGIPGGITIHFAPGATLTLNAPDDQTSRNIILGNQGGVKITGSPFFDGGVRTRFGTNKVNGVYLYGPGNVIENAHTVRVGGNKSNQREAFGYIVTGTRSDPSYLINCSLSDVRGDYLSFGGPKTGEMRGCRLYGKPWETDNPDRFLVFINGNDFDGVTAEFNYCTDADVGYYWDWEIAKDAKIANNIFENVRFGLRLVADVTADMAAGRKAFRRAENINFTDNTITFNPALTEKFDRSIATITNTFDPHNNDPVTGGCVCDVLVARNKARYAPGTLAPGSIARIGNISSRYDGMDHMNAGISRIAYIDNDVPREWKVRNARKSCKEVQWRKTEVYEPEE